MSATAELPGTDITTIVVGMDGSPGAHRALAWAAARAVETGAAILAVYVLTYSRQFVNDLPPRGMTTWRHSLEAELRGPWTEPARAAGAPVQIVVVEDDSAAAGLLAVAERERADLVVLGAHGRGSLADRVLGGTTYRVAHRSAAPVVVIPPDWGRGRVS